MLETLRPPAPAMAPSKTVAWLHEQLERGAERLLLMDCRAPELYESSHIESAISVALPGLMLRRLQRGNLPLRALFARGEEERERFARRCGTDTVVLYDESSSDWNENAAGESVLGLLLRRLKADGCKAFYLEGERAGRPDLSPPLPCPSASGWAPGALLAPPPGARAERGQVAADLRGVGARLCSRAALPGAPWGRPPLPSIPAPKGPPTGARPRHVPLPRRPPPACAGSVPAVLRGTPSLEPVTGWPRPPPRLKTPEPNVPGGRPSLGLAGPSRWPGGRAVAEGLARALSPPSQGRSGALDSPGPPLAASSQSRRGGQGGTAITIQVMLSSPPPPLLSFPGGFSRFQAEYALHCETNLDSSCSSSSPPLPVLGLGGLRISSDSSSDIESDIDRDPNSATDSDSSPLSNNQPSFPVEILPYLYLGCAKDSTNLDILEEFGIKYILNVTPNLPNLFENAGEFKYKQIPISDHWSQNLSQFFPEAISFIGEMLFILIETLLPGVSDHLQCFICFAWGVVFSSQRQSPSSDGQSWLDSDFS